jgi:hypothetical protein
LIGLLRERQEEEGERETQRTVVDRQRTARGIDQIRNVERDQGFAASHQNINLSAPDTRSEDRPGIVMENR